MEGFKYYITEKYIFSLFGSRYREVARRFRYLDVRWNVVISDLVYTIYLEDICFVDKWGVVCFFNFFDRVKMLIYSKLLKFVYYGMVCFFFLF